MRKLLTTPYRLYRQRLLTTSHFLNKDRFTGILHGGFRNFSTRWIFLLAVVLCVGVTTVDIETQVPELDTFTSSVFREGSATPHIFLVPVVSICRSRSPSVSSTNDWARPGGSRSVEGQETDNTCVVRWEVLKGT